ncbi:DUF134 domain-containing protein [Syntrophomonas wolfei]|jgi:predicted DNA-binding protein (UPF0251 family)|uniref:UPF0251 protein Swol_2090 n=1 Tax=Syntrophomonas wolfei subsp. wolfei (strain DSM 2245B / Goettingen) TaxID=335541 RepID=Y2090_SYNWW|nr:DUF134 domain-containing protein [Syntrophomonas wolfei]Q0AV72.1 RecName: Full=UPF0251 protein Swol_2090 [Syntrophomonas wolfei subsp. wolfei str. Goettingen G311]ABI69382.1 DNA-binding proteins-like protein [Syntrophomonas wolfei subsp. wolfei str. Goettingen G311]
MAREPRCRRVEYMPRVECFKPAGIPLSRLEEVQIKVEELEAIRLKDYLRLEQEDCARRMQVSRPTFQRILVEARAKIAYALSSGRAIRIEGGNYCMGAGYCRRRQREIREGEPCDFKGIAIRTESDATDN